MKLTTGMPISAASLSACESALGSVNTTTSGSKYHFSDGLVNVPGRNLPVNGLHWSILAHFFYWSSTIEAY